MRSLATTAGLLLLCLLTACADTRYYLQSVTGHLDLMRLARPVEQWLVDDSLAPALKQRLVLARQIRNFAVTELKLPDNASYRSYADLNRRAAVWNVVAAPEFSLDLKTWCFAVAGCIAYRGYFDEAEARAFGRALQADGLEVSVYGVPAYSTLGWLNWLGGDPLLNTFIRYPEGELARMIFHELAHQMVYVKDDSVFNESFATAVERLGAERWLSAHGSADAQREYAEFDARRRQFRALSLTTRRRLARIYRENESSAADINILIMMKNTALKEFRDDYARLRSSWRGYGAYDAWVAGANNAAFGAQAVYDEWVPAFEQLFAREGNDWQRFYDAVRQLANRPAAERVRLLKQISMEHASG
jgi:predicted aminopeptidase